MKIRKHKTIEIYFVLYLAALILLIPEKREIGQQESDVIARTYLPEMSLNIEQNTLNCFIDSDSLGLKIATIDSVNTFFGLITLKTFHSIFILKMQVLIISK
jgi:hypothetical protein